ncbi:MAG: transporter substrate-binding domain-containing protein, partial [Lachnospiraceae bacterium]|nr:transporter substrate-binding domain-containing protein [Lachnospiraceae bacterium]
MKRNLVQKIASVVAAGTLMMGALSGCGASNASVDSNESNATVESTDSSVTAESAGYRTLEEIKESGTINIGVFSDKSPFGYVDENGEYQGYDVYFAERIGKDLGVDINYVSTEAASRIEYLQTGKVDIILA